MARILLVAAHPESQINFRGDLLDSLVQAGHQVTALSAEAPPEIIAQLAKKGVGYCAYPIHRSGLSPIRDMQTFFALAKLFYQLNPEVVLCYTIKPIIWGGMVLLAMRRIRFFALITGLGFVFQDAGWRRKILAGFVSVLYWAALSRAEKVIFQNRDNLNDFVSKHIVNADKCAVVNGSGVDLLRFSEISLPKTGIVILSIGRLLGEKGFREYAHAARLVKSKYPEVTFQLVGPLDPSPDGICAEEVELWQKHGWLNYLGPASDVRPFIANCHLYVLPSYHEGMPRTVLEAMAMGRPILTTDVPGCRETVLSGKNGFLVPKSDAAALAERIIWFIENAEQWEQMGRTSRRIAEEKFDVHKVNVEMLRIMDLDLISGH